MENDFKQKAKNSSSFSMALEHELGASVMWGRRLNLSLEQNVNEDFTYDSDGEGSNFPPSLQNFSQKPIFLGADVVSLYPNMEKTHTGELIYRSVKECDISFNGIDYGRLAVYLFLVMGRAVMTCCGLEECIPVRLGKESNARSLGAKKNREMSNWSINAEHFSEQLKREMLARLMQIQTIILMSSSCYTFGGKIYKQMTGAGIGERGSACLAKAMMSIWDKIWSLKQCKSGLWIPLLIRYVDDIRSYVFPINEGWTWNGSKWTYDPDLKDGLSYEERTRQELLKTFNSNLEGINLTVESEMDFESGLLPTLDFQTRVRGDWEIEYTYFSKPMASGLVIQKGTALSNQTVFASLRQDLIRRLSHISDHFQVEEHEKIINTFTQNLVDSGHRYLFIRAIILQALTRFKYIKERNVLDESDARYNPMHRDRWYKFEERSKIKLTSKALWYTNKQVGDVYKQDWKRRIKRKGDDKNPHH